MATSPIRKNAAFSPRIAPVLQTLEALVGQASTPNWDGYGAQPVRSGAIEEAARVLEILPPEIPAPEPSVEPDGSVGLEWHARRCWTYVLTLSGRGEIEYAGLFGENETHGKERFRDIFPPLVYEHLRRLASPE